MSSFIVSHDCMTRTVNAILCVTARFADIDTLHHREDWCAERRAAGQRIGELLYALNRQAVRERYPTSPDLLGADQDWRFEPGAALIPHREYRLQRVAEVCVALKAIDCLSYQCCEGNIPRSALYQELRAIAAQLARRIVETMPAYNNAPWG